MLKSTRWHIEATRFDGYKVRISKLSDTQREINAVHIDSILSRTDESQPSSVEIKNIQNTFGLSDAEKSSIEREINSKKPIGHTFAYRKFLKAIFPDKKPSFPYLANYDDALVVVSKLSELFGKQVRLPNKDEAIKSLKSNNHLTGYRDMKSDSIKSPKKYGYAWLSGSASDESAPFAWHNRNGGSNSNMSSRRSSRSVIPIFE
jgi:hypothetical protein